MRIMRDGMLTGWAVSITALLLAMGPGRAAELSLQQAVQAPSRSAPYVARDPVRHPAGELGFFGVTPHATVIEIWPGGGYWTQILAPYLHDHGTYELATDVPGSAPEGHGFALSSKLKGMLAATPDVYGNVRFIEFGKMHPDLATPNSADVVLTFRNLHNWMRDGDAPALLAGIRRALKPGGVLGIEDHRGNTRTPQDPAAGSGYVRQDYAIALVEKAGFKLVGSSEINANPRDTADWPKGVWTLPPTFALGQTDRAKYQAIGEGDNFVLKFVKTGT
jgi:predicted methyltransferase